MCMKKISMVDEEYFTAFMKACREFLDQLNSKKKMTIKDRLYREYMITLIDNPSALNIVLYNAGRPEEMRRATNELCKSRNRT